VGAKIRRAAFGEQCYVLIRVYQFCNGAEMQVSDRIGIRVKLHDLHVLMAVVQAGNMSKAAALLNTTQPAISRSIAELERTIGVRLLDRNSQGVEVTEYGRVLLDGGAAVFDDLRQAVKNIRLLADPTTGEVRIGCSHFLAGSFVSAVIQRLFRRYPRIASHLVTAQADSLYRELSERNVDLLIAARWGSPIDERFEFESLFEDRFVVAASAQSRWARRRKIELAELVNEPWVLPPPRNIIASLALESFRASGLDYPRTIVITESPQVRLTLPATGPFLTMFAAAVLRFPARRTELKALPVPLPIAPVPIGIVTLKNRTLSSVARLFVKQAREVANLLAKPK
jgi:DNA-binding transcriptional LysR family regulator